MPLIAPAVGLSTHSGRSAPDGALLHLAAPLGLQPRRRRRGGRGALPQLGRLPLLLGLLLLLFRVHLCVLQLHPLGALARARPLGRLGLRRVLRRRLAILPLLQLAQRGDELDSRLHLLCRRLPHRQVAHGRQHLLPAEGAAVLGPLAVLAAQAGGPLAVVLALHRGGMEWGVTDGGEGWWWGGWGGWGFWGVNRF